MMKRSVPATPTGAFSTTTSWPFSRRYLVVFSQQNSWKTMVALACSAASTSALVVPPSYMRNSPSVGVFHTSDGSQSMFTVAPNSEKMRLISFMLPTTKPSKPPMKLMLSLGTRTSGSVGLALAVPEVLQHAEQRVVVAGDVAADEGRRVREGHVELGRHAALFLASS